MHRNAFLKLGAVLGTYLAAPIQLLARSYKNRVGKGFKVESGKDRFDKSITLFEGDQFFCKISGNDTDGDLYVYESTRLKNGGPAVHYHYEQDEWWYVLKGEFLIKVGDETYHAKKGDSVFGPRKIPHAFAKIGEGEATLLMIFQPAGKMEDFFLSISKGVEKTMTPEEKIKFRRDHGIEVVGPALDYLKQ